MSYTVHDLLHRNMHGCELWSLDDSSVNCEAEQQRHEIVTHPQCIGMQPFFNLLIFRIISYSHRNFMMIFQMVQELSRWQTSTPTHTHKQTLLKRNISPSCTLGTNVCTAWHKGLRLKLFMPYNIHSDIFYGLSGDLGPYLPRIFNRSARPFSSASVSSDLKALYKFVIMPPPP